MILRCFGPDACMMHEDLPVERVRSRVSAYIYGNIFVLAALFAPSPESVAHWTAVVIVVATSATTFFAHVVAHNIGQAIGRTDDEDLRVQLAREARDAVPIMTSGTVPAVLLGLGAVGWLPPGLSQLLADASVSSQCRRASFDSFSFVLRSSSISSSLRVVDYRSWPHPTLLRIGWSATRRVAQIRCCRLSAIAAAAP
jgi:hypothetical protein